MLLAVLDRLPALPCCHVHLRGRKPQPPGYPHELRTLGDHLRKRRLNLGLLQREAAERIGVDTTTITNWELGHTAPALCWLPKVIRFLGYDPQAELETVGQSLKRYRQRQGMPQRELANRLGVDPGTLGRWERGERSPTGHFGDRVRGLLEPALNLDNHPERSRPPHDWAGLFRDSSRKRPLRQSRGFANER
jgi:transcriptional regulator with XRE-family HTH domain